MSVIFGPVPSRRLGYSLGIDLLPAANKTCTLNCLYCQVGQTKTLTVDRSEPVPFDEIARAIDKTLPVEGIHYVTFSGSGEPTLHKHLGRFIDLVRKKCSTPVAVITNSSLIDRPDVQNDLAKADLLVPSLDAVSPEVFAKINRPHPAIRPENIARGLKSFAKSFRGRLWLEIMLVKGVNDHLEEIFKLKAAAEEINPHKIQLNTVTRPPSEPSALAVSPADMARIAALFGPKAEVVGLAPKDSRQGDAGNLEEEVLELIKRRSITLNDLVTSHGLHRDLAADLLEKLCKEKKIKKVVHGGVTYYREYY